MRASRGLSFLLGISVLGSAAAPGQTVREEVKVDVVTVRLTARDARGRPVTDLKPSDFALSIDGRAHAIDTLALVSTPTARTAEGAAGAPGAAPRVTVAPPAETLPIRTAIFLDEGETKVSDRAKVYGELARYLESAGPAEELLVARFDGSEMEVVTPWTADRAAAGAALKRLAANPGREKIASVSAASRAIRNGSALAAGGGAGQLGTEYGTLAEMDRFRAHLQRALLEVVAAFPAEPATKRIVFVTSGTLLARPSELAEAFKYPHVEQVNPEAATCSSVRCLRRVEAGRGAFALWQRAASPPPNSALTMDDVVLKALEHDVAVVPVAADPFAGGQDLGLDARYAMPADTASLHGDAVKALWEIAEESGTEAILVPGKTAARLGEMGGRAAYELTFRDPFADHHLHGIGIVCRRPGVRVDYRRGYRIPPEEERTLDTVVARLARTGSGADEAGVTLTLAPAESNAALTRLRLTFDAPAETELGDERTFDVIGVGQRDDGARTEPVRWTAVGERVDEASAKFTAASDLKVPYGRYTWSFAVTDVETGLTSYALVPPPSSR